MTGSAHSAPPGVGAALPDDDCPDPDDDVPVAVPPDTVPVPDAA